MMQSNLVILSLSLTRLRDRNRLPGGAQERSALYNYAKERIKRIKRKKLPTYNITTMGLLNIPDDKFSAPLVLKYSLSSAFAGVIVGTGTFPFIYYQSSLMKHLKRFLPRQIIWLTVKDSVKIPFPTARLEAERRWWQLLAVNCLAGGLAGVTRTTILLPFETPRVVHAINALQKKSLYGTPYRISLPHVFASHALILGLYDTLTIPAREIYKPYKESMWERIKLNFSVALVTTYTSQVLLEPWNAVLMRVIRQLESNPSFRLAYRGYGDCLQKIWKEEGARGLFSGGFLPSTVIVSSLLVVYDEVKRLL